MIEIDDIRCVGALNAQRRGRRPLAGLLALGAGIAAVVATTPPAGASAPPAMTARERGYANAIVRELNHERSAHHLPALRVNKALTAAARGHNRSMRSRNTLSHQLRGEADFHTRDTRAGYRHATAWGENIAYTQSVSAHGAVAMQRAMYGERPPNDPHRRNILLKQFRDVGVAVLVDTRHHKLWLTVDFGRH